MDTRPIWLILLLLAAPAQAVQHTWIIDQTGDFGDIIQIYRNDTESQAWEQQANISEGIITFQDNASYIIQLEAKKDVVLADVTNPNWLDYQLRNLLWFFLGIGVVAAFIAIGAGILAGLFYLNRWRTRL